MFTQCPNCQAIFRVSMRDVTVAKGFLRCGECQTVFDSSENLSTTMQEPFVGVEEVKESIKHISQDELNDLSDESLKTLSALDNWQDSASTPVRKEHIDIRQSPTVNSILVDDINSIIPDADIESPEVITESPEVETESSEAETESSEIENESSEIENESPEVESELLEIENESPDLKNELLEAEEIQEVVTQKTKKSKWPLITALLLFLLFIVQLGYNYRHEFLDIPRYEPEKIQMLNHNVFAHPTEKDILLISASIENIADFDQRFPTLEVRLTDSKSEVVALRRFTPDEYLDNYSEKTLLKKKRATSIKLRIKDPGSQATRFQFDFL